MNNEKNIKNEKLYLLLDSSLISATFNDIDKPRLYDFKVVECGSFIQVYYFKHSRIKNPKNDDDLDLNLKKINFEYDSPKKEAKLKSFNEIEEKNINRSKFQCQRIAKSNMEYWKTFITLTFADNVTELKIANKRFKYFVDKVRRIKKDFRYICVPEFQKRGAIHYHLLTNLSCDSFLVPKRPLKRLYNKESKTWEDLEYYDLKFWNEGFSSAKPTESDSKKVIGYISKYMTKDIDNKLFGYRRFFYSQNCFVPKVSYIDSFDKKQMEFLQEKIQDLELIYQNEYLNTYDDSKVSFLEYSTPQEHFTTK